MHSTTVGTVTVAYLVKLSIAPKVPSASAVQVLFLPDIGAELDAIPRETFRRVFKGVTLVSVASLETATGSPIMNENRDYNFDQQSNLLEGKRTCFGMDENLRRKRVEDLDRILLVKKTMTQNLFSMDRIMSKTRLLTIATRR